MSPGNSSSQIHGCRASMPRDFVQPLSIRLRSGSQCLRRVYRSFQGSILALIMPIPALSKSYKPRLQGDKAHDEPVRTQVQRTATRSLVPFANLAQLAEGAMSGDETPRMSNIPDTSMRPPHNRTSSYQSDVDSGSRRRSLLPQPGQARQTSQQPTTTVPKAENSINLKQPVAGRPRLRSSYQTATAQSGQGRKEEPIGTSRSLRQPSAIGKPQTAGLGRSSSLRKPSTSTQAIPSTQSRTHSRTQSTSNASNLRREVSNAGGATATHSRTQSTSNTSNLRREASNAESSTARPKSLVGPSSLKSNGSSSMPPPAAPRASARLAGLTRTAIVRPRSETATKAPTPDLVSRPDDPEVSLPARRETPTEEPTKTTKPAFSTLQQHFTPRKTGKALTSTFLHPAPTSGVSTTLAPEIITLQSELLQLHLLHTASADVSQHWHLSARQTLHKKFLEVASLHQAMLEYERAGQEQKNLQALLEWSGGSSSMGLIEYVQILSGPLHELPSLLEPGGRCERLVDEFDRWMTRVEYLWSTRSDAALRDGDSRSIEGLSDEWKGENMALIRKVTSFARDLEQVRKPSSGSSIAGIVETCTTLLRGLSEELQLMQTLETGVVAKEKDWVEARLQAIARDAGTTSIDTDKGIAAWRS
jgi:hypothetical protein